MRFLIIALALVFFVKSASAQTCDERRNLIHSEMLLNLFNDFGEAGETKSEMGRLKEKANLFEAFWGFGVHCPNSWSDHRAFISQETKLREVIEIRKQIDANNAVNFVKLMHSFLDDEQDLSDSAIRAMETDYDSKYYQLLRLRDAVKAVDLLSLSTAL